MSKPILVRGARQLLTLRGPSGPRRGSDLQNLGPVQDGAVLIEGGVVREVGPSRRIENLSQARNAEEIDATGCLVMPGLVDCFTHLVSGPVRLRDSEMQLDFNHEAKENTGNGTLAVARSIQELSLRALESMALRTLEGGLRHGTTAIETRSGLGLTDAGELKILRVQTALQKRPIHVTSTLQCARAVPGFEDRPDDLIAWVCSHLLPLIKRRKLAEFVAICCGPLGFTASEAARVLNAAKQLRFPLRVEAGAGSDAPAIRLALSFGAASVDHLTDPREHDLACLAQSNAIATLLPGIVFWRGSGRYPPARRWIDRGVAVALASGYNPETSGSQNMQMMIALACRCMGMTAAEAIAASTFNAAHALGHSSVLGSLESGKRADLLVLNVSDYRELPYHFGVNLVDLAMVNGQILARRSEVQWPAG